LQPSPQHLEEAPAGWRRAVKKLASRQVLSAATTLTIRVASAGIGYVVQFALARVLGATEYGVFALAWLWVTIGGFAGCFGFSQTVVRFLPRYLQKGDLALHDAFLTVGRRVVALVSGVLALGGAAATLLAGGWAGAIAPFLIAAACVPVFAYADLLEGLARSRGWLSLAFIPPYILRQLLVLGFVAGAYSLGWPGTAVTAMVASFAALVIAATVQHVLIMRRMPAADTPKKSLRRVLPLWLRSGGLLFLADGARLLRTYGDTIVLSAFLPPAAVGIYFAATRVASVLGFVEYSVSAAMGYRFAAMAASGDRRALARRAAQAVVVTLVPVLVGGVALWLLGGFVLGLFGQAFIAGTTVLPLLIAAQVLRAAVGPADDLLNVLGRERWTFMSQLAGLLVNVATGLLLVPVLGIVGAGLASLAAMAATTVILGTGAWLLLGSHLRSGGMGGGRPQPQDAASP